MIESSNYFLIQLRRLQTQFTFSESWFLMQISKEKQQEEQQCNLYRIQFCLLAKERYLRIAARYKVLGDQCCDGRNVYVCQNGHTTILTIAVLVNQRRRIKGGDYF